MKRFYICIIFTIAFVFTRLEINAQGCVAIKGTAGICGRPSDAKGWELNLNNLRQGDAAFADYLVSAGVSFRL